MRQYGVMMNSRWKVVAAALLATGCDKQIEQKAPTVPEVPVTAVVAQDVPIYLEAVGETAGSLDIQIRARVDGVIEELHFDEGSAVKKDQLLYSIDPGPFEAKLREAEGKLAEANARFLRAVSNLKRVEPLVEIDALSKSTLDDAISEHDATQGIVSANKAMVENANIELGYTKVHSPVNGLIGISEGYAGDYVGRYPNPVVLNTVSKLDPIKVRFSITEADYLRLVRRYQASAAKSGSPSQGEKPKQGPDKDGAIELFLADRSLFPHRGTVAFAGREIDAKTGTLTIEATFPNPDKSVRPGQFARVRFSLETKKGALLVPQRSVRELQGTYQVFVVNDQNQVETRRVKVGVRVEDLWLIEDGVKAGEKVAVAALHRLRSDMTVKPVPAEPSKGDKKPGEAGS